MRLRTYLASSYIFDPVTHLHLLGSRPGSSSSRSVSVPMPLTSFHRIRRTTKLAPRNTSPGSFVTLPIQAHISSSAVISRKSAFPGKLRLSERPVCCISHSFACGRFRIPLWNGLGGTTLAGLGATVIATRRLSYLRLNYRRLDFIDCFCSTPVTFISSLLRARGSAGLDIFISIL